MPEGKPGNSAKYNMYLKETVFLTQVHTLFPSVVSFVQISANASEFDEFVFLQGLCECNVVKVIKGINAGP